MNIKKLLASVLALVMILSVLPIGVIADEANGYDLPGGEFIEPVGEITISYTSTLGFNNGAEYLEYDKAVEVVREQLKAFNPVTIIPLKTDEMLTENILSSLLFDAMAHTGDSKAGDYLAYQFSSYRIGATNGWTDGTAYYFTVQFNVEFFTTPEQEALVDAKVSEVIASLDLAGKSEYEKIKAIYDYITQNVGYDYDNLYDGSYILKHSAYAALINKTAVCQGYAVLFYRLALEAGLDARVISGIGNGGRHDWNIVKIGNFYYNLDSTWDDESSPDNYRWLLLNDADFLDHERDAEYLTESFYYEYPMAQESYKPETSGGSDNPDGIPDDTIVGDIDGNGAVTNADAIYLLYNVIFGDGDYPVNQNCDFNGDGAVTNADAIYLLYHVIFGNDYPLSVN